MDRLAANDSLMTFGMMISTAPARQGLLLLRLMPPVPVAVISKGLILVGKLALLTNISTGGEKSPPNWLADITELEDVGDGYLCRIFIIVESES